jgi:FAD/FMN-containing dehydrogenase
MSTPTDPAVGPRDDAGVPALDPATAALVSRFVTPDAADWDGARQGWNLAVDLQPAALFLPESGADVAAVTRYCAASGRRLAMQSTGHGALTLEALDDAVLVRTSRLRGVAIDADNLVARVAAGTQWREVTMPAAEHGLAPLAGMSPVVGVAGYALGGGIGWLSRRYGLACNSVRALEVVTADGEERRVDADHEPDLFWALRGGGGSFAAVTALELTLVPVLQVHAGTLLWPLESAAPVLHAWRAWTGDVPDTVTSVGRVLRLPPIPDVPEPLRGRDLVAVEAVFLTDQAEADHWLQPLRALQPEFDTFATIPPPALGELHGDPEDPVPGLGDHRLLAELPAEAVEALLAVAGPGRDCPLLSVEVRHLGGALGRSEPTHGALDRIPAAYAVFALGMPVAPELAAAIPPALAALRSALEPWDAGREYLNFAEQPSTPLRIFGADTLSRLEAVKRAYDPDNRFVSNHPVVR